MILSSLFAFIHFLAAFGVAISVVLERVLIKQEISHSQATLIRKIDGYYGLAAVLVLVVGFLRVFYFEKGSEFYFSDTFFLLKLGLFVIIGLLSIYPTIVFFKWKKMENSEYPISLDHNQFINIKRILNLEILVLILLLLSASMMAKGIGF